MTSSLRWTIADLEALPENGNLYEIIDGALYVSKQPHWQHQTTCTTIAAELVIWSRSSGMGLTLEAPGVIYTDDEAVAPDIVWINRERLATVLGEDGKLHGSPDLVVEVLSPGMQNEQRDREAKRRLYSRQGVCEYWIADWRTTRLEVYRRQQAELRLVQTLLSGDELISPLLPGFACVIDRFFEI